MERVEAGVGVEVDGEEVGASVEGAIQLLEACSLSLRPAEVMKVSLQAVMRDWKRGRAWLMGELAG